LLYHHPPEWSEGDKQDEEREHDKCEGKDKGGGNAFLHDIASDRGENETRKVNVTRVEEKTREEEKNIYMILH
jgi:hypothetical protein